MSTATPAAPLTSPGPTAQYLAKLAAVGGLGLMCLGVVLAVVHPLPDLTAALLKYGMTLLGGSPVIYGGYTTFLKYASMVKPFIPEAEALAKAVPGPLGTDLQAALALAHKLADALPDPSGHGGSPLAQALAAAAATPVAPPASPASPGSA